MEKPDYLSLLSEWSSVLTAGDSKSRKNRLRSNLHVWWLGIVTRHSLGPEALAWRLVAGSELQNVNKSKIRNAISLLLEVGKAGMFQAHIWNKYGGFAKEASKKPGIAPDAIIFFDYLAHLSPPGQLMSEFASGYWGPLVQELGESEMPTTYVHIHYPGGQIRSTSDARNLLQRWNQNRSNQRHILLQQLTDFSILLKTMRDYFQMAWSGFMMRKALHEEKRFDTYLRLAHQDWIESFCGPPAAEVAFLTNLFEKLLSEIPHQRIGIYLQEGQPWEFTLIAAWRRFGHGTLIGVPHSTVRYWDLRYARDARTYRQSGEVAMPRPDFVAANGPQAKRQMLEDGYPADEIIEVEALRYMHLAQGLDRTSLQATSRHVRVLLLGEYYEKSTATLLAVATEALNLLGDGFILKIRPHPAAPEGPDFAKWHIEVLGDTGIREAVEQADVVIAMSTTSAVLDSYCAGVPTIVVEDPMSLNGSPLLDLGDVPFVQNSKQLASAMRELIANLPLREFRGDMFFYLDPKLPRWRKLLGFR